MSKLWTPSRELHLPTPELIGFFLEVGAWDKAGKLYHQEQIRSRSPVKQFLQYLLSNFRDVDLAGMVDTGGTSRTLHKGYPMRATAALNNDLCGIVIGTGSTAVDITNYALVTKIAHGTAAGQMIYNALDIDAAVTVADPDCTFVMSRNFNNNSGGSITVRETGIYVWGLYQPTPTLGYWCIVRDVPTAVTVPDGGGCYVKYTLKVTE